MKYLKDRKLANLVLLILAILLISITNISEKTFNENKRMPIYSVKTDEKKIALTFDVNWAENDYLMDILDVLDENDVKATFFVMGKWVIYPEGNKEKLIEINKRGHEIGNHSYVHPDFKKINESRACDEIKKTEDIIYENTGIKTNLFRFPSGSYSEQMIETVQGLNYFPIHWDVDSVDWKEADKNKEYNRVLKNVKEGSIVLFHNNAKYTPDNLKRLIPELRGEGYQFVKVSDIIYKDNFFIDNEGKQNFVN